MAGNDEERALRATVQLHQVVEELRAFLTAAVAAELQASRASRDNRRGRQVAPAPVLHGRSEVRFRPNA